MTFVQNNLGSNVLRGAAKSPRLAAEANAFGKSKVNLNSNRSQYREYEFHEVSDAYLSPK